MAPSFKYMEFEKEAYFSSNFALGLAGIS